VDLAEAVDDVTAMNAYAGDRIEGRERGVRGSI
jgi:hypothetical protein